MKDAGDQLMAYIKEAAIRGDRRPRKAVAAQYGISIWQVSSIRTGKSRSRVNG